MADDGGDEDLDSLDVTACKERIQQLQADRERRREHIERLQEKLKNMNSELATRKAEQGTFADELKEQQRKNKQNSSEGQLALRDSGKAAKEMAGKDRVRRYMEEMLSEKVKKHVDKNEFGFPKFDETELMVEKPMEEQTKEQSYIDTVLVTRMVPNTDFKYQLSYRVDRRTSCKKLREDACRYWGLSEVEWILRTMDNSKAHDDLSIQNCFRLGELVNLLLTVKTPLNTSLMAAEQKAFAPQTGKNARLNRNKSEDNPDDPNKAGTQKTFDQQLQDIPGLHEQMTTRDENIIAQLDRIRLRNIWVYLFMSALTLMSLNQLRPQDVEFSAREGLVELMSAPQQDPETNIDVVRYSEIATEEQVWDWLIYGLSNRLMNGNSSVRKHHFLPGHLFIRVQQVKEVPCKMGKFVPSGVDCYPPRYDSATAATEDIMPLYYYWENITTTPAPTSTTTLPYTTTTTSTTTLANETLPDYTRHGKLGRGSLSPWKYIEGQNWGRESGNLQSYDSTGYSVEYDLQFMPMRTVYQTYREDMEIFKTADWISKRTRAIHVQFTAYNANHDRWFSILFLLETPPNGRVYTMVKVHQFKPSIIEFEFEDPIDLLVTDCIRLMLAVYILFFHTSWEMAYERSRGKGASDYLFGFYGIADICLCGFYIFIFCVRYVSFGPAVSTKQYIADLQAQFVSSHVDGYMFHQHTVFESIVFTCLVLRLTTFFRMNRLVYIIWVTLRESSRLGFRFAFVFLPILFGMIVMAHAVWGAYLPVYNQLSSSVVGIIMTVLGDFNPEMFKSNRPWSTVLGLLMYALVNLFLVNGWIAVLIHVYQKTRVRAGYKPSDYSWKEYQYAKWALWTPVANIYFTYLRPDRFGPVPQPKGEDDEDE